MPVVGLFLNGLMWQFIFSKGINQLKHVDKKKKKTCGQLPGSIEASPQAIVAAVHLDTWLPTM